MSDITSPSGPATENPTDKGKGKATAPEEEESDSSDEETGQLEVDQSDVDDEDLVVLDSKNIIGPRTRGKHIDFAKAAQDDLPDEEDEEDDEYCPPDEDTAPRGPGNDGMDLDP